MMMMMRSRTVPALRWNQRWNLERPTVLVQEWNQRWSLKRPVLTPCFRRAGEAGFEQKTVG